MREYEVIFLVHPELDENGLNEIIKKISTWISEGGGEIMKIEQWGKKKLAYLIRKQKEGHYYLFNIKSPPQFSAQLERNLRLLEPILRFSITVKK